VVSKIRSFAVAACAIFASSCNIENEPKPVDARPYIGCYADGPLKLKLENSTLWMNGKVFPYSIQFRKVGYIINSHFIVEGSGDYIQISPSDDERFYRILISDGALSVMITDGESRVYTLKRQSLCWE
jgi:hypothetical protein